MAENSLTAVTGDLFYRERIALPPEAQVTVEIAYRPANGGAPVVVGYAGYQAGGKQVPLPFSVPYDEGEIDGRRNYFIRASIMHPAARFCFTSGTEVHVITRDAPVSGVQVLMRQSAAPETVSGTVSYRERSALRPDSVLTVRLVDISRADAPSVTLGEQRYVTDGRQVPLPFAITYDPAAIDPRFTYSVQARIDNGVGLPLFVTDTVYPVITRERPTQDVAVWVRAI